MTDGSLHKGDFAERLVSARESLTGKKALSKTAAARRLGVEPKRYYHWETGEAFPRLEQLYALCELFDVSADLLLFGKSAWPFEDADHEKVKRLSPVTLAKVGAALVLISSEKFGIDIAKRPELGEIHPIKSRRAIAT